MSDKGKEVSVKMHVFIQFLHHHNLLDQWLTNVIDRVCTHDNDYMNDHKLSEMVNSLRLEPAHLIDTPFTWVYTPEGDKLWLGIHNSWERAYKELHKILKGYKYE